MKTKLLKLLALITGFGVAAAAYAGDIYEIKTCDEYGSPKDYGASAANPLGAGETIYFVVRLNNRNEEGKSYVQWNRVYSGTEAEFIADAYNPLKLGLYTRGSVNALGYAELVSLAANSTNPSRFTDLIFKYTTKVGDFAMPIRLATTGGGAAGLTGAGSTLFLANTDRWAIQATVGGETVDAEFSMGNPSTAVTPPDDSRVNDYSLAESSLYVQTIDFDSNWDSTETGSEAWRSVHQDSNVCSPTTPHIVVGDGTVTLEEARTVYVWSDNEAAVQVVSENVNASGLHYGTIKIAGGESQKDFTLKGIAEGGEANLILSAYSDYNTEDGTGDLVVDYVTVPVKCIEPMPASLVAEAVETSVYADSDYLTSKATINVYLSQAYADANLTVKLVPDFATSVTGVDIYDYVRFSTTATSLSILPDGEAPTVTINAGTTSKHPVYVYFLRGDKNSTLPTGQIKFTPVIVGDDVAAAAITTKVSCGIEAKAKEPEIVTPAEYSTIEGVSGSDIEFTLTIEDTYADQTYLDTTGASGYEIYVKYNNTKAFQKLDGYYGVGEDGQLFLVKETAEGSGVYALSSDTPILNYPTGSGDDPFTSVVYVKAPVSGKKSAYRYYYADIAYPRTSTVTSDASEYYEGKNMTATVTLSSVNDTGNTIYAFLRVTDSTIKDAMFGTVSGRKFILCDDTDYTKTVGIPINANNTSGTGVVTLLDGAAAPGLGIQFDVVLATTPQYSDATKIAGYASNYLTVNIINVEPVIDHIEMDGFESESSGYSFGEIARGLTRTFKAVTTDAGAYDLESGFKTKWTLKLNGAQKATATIEGNPNDDANAYTYTFKSAGTWTIEAKVQDKDMSTWSTVYQVILEVVKNPSVTIEHDSSYVENESPRYIHVGLSQFPAEDPLVVKVTVTPPAGDNAGTLTLDSEYKTVPAGYAALADNEYYLEFEEAETKDILIEEMDGTVLSASKGFTVKAEVVVHNPVVEEDTYADTGDLWSDYFTASQEKIYVQNIAPTYIQFTEQNTNAWTVAGGLAEAYPITFTLSGDVDADMAAGLTVTIIGAKDGTMDPAITDAQGTLTKFTIKDGDPLGYTFTPNFGNAQGDQSVTITVADKDKGTLSFTYNYFVKASKFLKTVANGPSAGTANVTLSQIYAKQKGIGEGHVYVPDATFSTAKEFTMEWNCSSLNTIDAYGYGYKVGAVDDGTLDSAKDIAIGADGATYATGDYYAYEDEELDSFLYGWVLGATDEDGSSTYTASLSPETFQKSAPAMVSLPTAMTEDGNGYLTTYAEAVFAKEFRAKDNVGDINQDGVPDIKFVEYFLTTEEQAEGGSSLGDVENIASSNDDEDYFPAGWQVGNAITPGTTNSWTTAGIPFSAYYEIRGWGAGLNAYKNAAGMIEPDYTANEMRAYLLWKGVNDKSTLAGMSTNDVATAFEAVYDDAMADLTSGAWTPERPTDPTVEDTDGDGLPDGYEYWYWYGAKVGYEAKNAYGVYVWQGPMVGHKMKSDDIEAGEEISPEEIMSFYDPLVAGETVGQWDIDNDGLADLEELVVGTNPLEWDTDGDGMADGYEVIWDLNPLSDDGSGLDAYNPDGDYMAYASGFLEFSYNGADGEEHRYLVIPTVSSTEDIETEQLEVRNDLIQASTTGSFTFYGTPFTGGEKTIGGEKIPEGITRATKITITTDMLENGSWVMDASLDDSDYCLMHNDVYVVFGFDPRTAWYGFGGVVYNWSRWSGDAQLAVNTVKFYNLYEYQWIKWAGLSYDSVEELFKHGTRPTISYADDGTTIQSHGADTDGDGIPDGWEIYVGYSPILASNTNDEDEDLLNLGSEYCGTDSVAAYSGCASIASGTNGWTWINKFWPTDPGSPDTDGDGLDDFTEQAATWSGKYPTTFSAAEVFHETFSFQYGSPSDDGTACIRGGGLNPCTIDTDGDFLPDAWEYQYAGLVHSTSNGVEYVDGGMDGTDPRDASNSTKWKNAEGINVAKTDPLTGTNRDYDFDGDGLQNYQEYLVQAMRHFRYDDSKTPMMGYILKKTLDDTRLESDLFSGITAALWDNKTDDEKSDYRSMVAISLGAEYGVNVEAEDIEVERYVDHSNGDAECVRFYGYASTFAREEFPVVTFNPYSQEVFKNTMALAAAEKAMEDEVAGAGGKYDAYAAEYPALWKSSWVSTKTAEYANAAYDEFLASDEYVAYTNAVAAYDEYVANVEAYKADTANFNGLDYESLDDTTDPTKAEADAAIDAAYPPVAEPESRDIYYFLAQAQTRAEAEVDAAYEEYAQTEEYALAVEVYVASRFAEDSGTDLESQGIDYVALGYFSETPMAWDPVRLSTVGLYTNYELADGMAGARYMLIPEGATKYLSTDPRLWDTDNDGMDDHWEIFHGLNPLYGGETKDELAERLETGSAFDNKWTEVDGVDSLVYNPVLYPWVTGDPMFDADGDGLRNDEERLAPNLASPENYHTDPSPYWYTDTTGERPFTRQFYKWDLYGELSSYWTRASDYMFAFEENEGFDSDNDWTSDSVEQVRNVYSASDALDATDPDRREALYFPGENAAAISYEPNRRTLGAVDLLKQFTVEAWVRPEEVKKEQVILERVAVYGASTLTSQNNLAEGEAGYIRANFRLGFTADGCLYAMFDGSDSKTSGTDTFKSCQVNAETKSYIKNDTWAHIAATYDGKVFTLYRDGEAQLKKECTLIPANGVSVVKQDPTSDEDFSAYEYEALNAAFILGASAKTTTGVLGAAAGDAASWDTDFGDFYKGYIAEVSVWDGARTADEIAADYSDRTRRALADASENRDDVFATMYAGNTEVAVASRNDNDGSSVLPPELVQHYNFANLPSAISAENVKTSPTGFDSGVAANALDMNGDVIDLNVGWWNGYSLKSTVYTDYRVVPWIENTVDHLPIYDGSTIDSLYWGKYFSGFTPATVTGNDAFVFPNTALPYTLWNDDNDREWHKFHIGFADIDTDTQISLSNRYTYTERQFFNATSDLIPIGGAFAKSCPDFFDDKGATTPAEETDADEDGLADWWEEKMNSSSANTWSGDLGFYTLVTRDGVTMAAWQWYLEDLATGVYSDHTYENAFDDNGDGMPDWWADLFDLEGDANDDDDGDGLTNYMEYLLTKFFKFGKVFDPTDAYSINDYYTDYFFPIGQLYIGEIFTDNDMCEDEWENQFEVEYSSRTVWDALADYDEDGWSNFAEVRYNSFCAENHANLITHMAGEDEFKDMPVPTLNLTLRYNGILDLSDESASTESTNSINQIENSMLPIVINAYSKADPVQPDATWTIYPGEEREQEVRIGGWQENVVRGVMGPGHIQASKVSLYRYTLSSDAEFYWDVTYTGTYTGFGTITSRPSDSNVWVIRGTWSQYYKDLQLYGYSRIYLHSSDYQSWVPVDDVTVVQNATTLEGSFMYGKTTIGTFDGVTGRFELSLASLANSYSSATDTNSTIFVAENSLFSLRYTTTVPTLQENKLEVSLGEATKGYLREGTSKLVAFVDMNKDGYYTIGEPMGTVDATVGWYEGNAEIELTDTSAITTRINVFEDESDSDRVVEDAITQTGRLGDITNDVEVAEIEESTAEVLRGTRVRVVRYAVDGWPRYTLGVDPEVVLDRKFYRDDDGAGWTTITEADFLTNGRFDIDWDDLAETIDEGGIEDAGSDCTNVTYIVVIGDGEFDTGTISFRSAAATNTVYALEHTINRYFDDTASRQRPIIVAPGAQASAVYGARPTFKWSMNGNTSYTAFRIVVMSGSTEVYNSGIRRAPAPDRDGVYTFFPNVYAGDQLLASGEYTWRVTMYNAKFRNNYWSEDSTFRMNTLTHSDNYGSIRVAAKYFGPRKALNAATVRVEAFDTPDFSGMPVARTYVSSANLATVYSTSAPTVNATLVGLPKGKYYVRAYLDFTSRGTARYRDSYESWGYVAPRAGTGSYLLTPTTITIGDTLGDGDLFVCYIEDVDTNGNNLPDAWELAEGKSLAAGAELIDTTLSNGVAMNTTLGAELLAQQSSGTSGSGLAAYAFTVLNNAGVAALALDIEPSGYSTYNAALAANAGSVEGSSEATDVKFTLIATDDGSLQVKATGNAETVTSSSARSVAALSVYSAGEVSSTLTGAIYVSDDLKTWTKSSVTVTVNINSDGTFTTDAIDLSAYAGGTKKFFKIVMD